MRDGQFTERSTLTYNVVTDRALLVMAAKLKRPELLEPVRQNLRSLLYLLHADGEVVTEISRRQDQFTRGGTNGYWFPLTYLALDDSDAAVRNPGATLRRAAHACRRCSSIRSCRNRSRPELRFPPTSNGPSPRSASRASAAGPLSATLVLGGSSRILSFRYGDAVIEGVRFATAFFGKGQFVPDAAETRDSAYVFRQALEAPYYQPLCSEGDAGDVGARRAPQRRQSEVCRLEQSAEITERPNGFAVRIARGRDRRRAAGGRDLLS